MSLQGPLESCYSLRIRTIRTRPGPSLCRSWLLAACAASALYGCGSSTRRAGADAAADASPLGDATAEAAAKSSDASADVDASDAGAEGPTRPFEGHKKVLHIGDSTVGYASGLQLEFKKMFPDAGISYVSHTMTSAGLHTVAEDRIVEKLVRRNAPDLVIVQLGTNNLTVPHPEVYLPDIQSIVSQIGARACYWIGPISLKFPERGMRVVLRDHVAPCVFYDSYDLTLERQPDGLHPSQKAAIQWSALFFEFAAQHPASR